MSRPSWIKRRRWYSPWFQWLCWRERRALARQEAEAAAKAAEREAWMRFWAAMHHAMQPGPDLTKIRPGDFQ